MLSEGLRDTILFVGFLVGTRQAREALLTLVLQQPRYQYLSIISIDLSIHLYLSIYLSIYLYLCLSLSVPVCMSFYLSLPLSVCLAVCLFLSRTKPPVAVVQKVCTVRFHDGVFSCFITLKPRVE